MEVDRQRAERPRHQCRVGRGAATDHAVDVVGDDIDFAITDADIQLDLRIARLEIRQRRHPPQPRSAYPAHARCWPVLRPPSPVHRRHWPAHRPPAAHSSRAGWRFRRACHRRYDGRFR
ncbi:hypothetical protein G6F59_016793 [Rhizopus arrhizus]|nr:hypothetical protein G6F59_016793 [Rhizopus arrhizus]